MDTLGYSKIPMSAFCYKFSSSFWFLFSGGGVGDVGIEWGSKIPVIASLEIIPSRAQ